MIHKDWPVLWPGACLKVRDLHPGKVTLFKFCVLSQYFFLVFIEDRVNLFFQKVLYLALLSFFVIEDAFARRKSNYLWNRRGASPEGEGVNPDHAQPGSQGLSSQYLKSFAFFS